MPVNDKMILNTNNTAMLVAKKSKMRIIDKNSLNKIITKTRSAIMAIINGKSSMPMNFIKKMTMFVRHCEKKCGEF